MHLLTLDNDGWRFVQVLVKVNDEVAGLGIEHVVHERTIDFAAVRLQVEVVADLEMATRDPLVLLPVPPMFAVPFAFSYSCTLCLHAKIALRTRLELHHVDLTSGSRSYQIVLQRYLVVLSHAKVQAKEVTGLRVCCLIGSVLCVATDLVQELGEWVDQVFFEVELVVVHLGWHVQVRLCRSCVGQLLRMRVVDQSICFAMQQEDWALCIPDRVDVSELLFNDEGEERYPAELLPGCLLDRGVWRHQQEGVRLLDGREVGGRAAAHRPAEENDVLLLDANALGQVLIDCQSILLDCLLCWL